ncbi:MAG: hypothetical protein KAS32_27355 [Candidatus Peribacteraceae bacterium]|nr:hypothetical protein [Candidatus Peribacteraceae bacterium]
MREIKFRAWDKINDCMFDVATLTWLVGGLKIEDPATISEFQGENCILMQFTGLLDKNGVEIYEGDVVRFDETDITPPELAHKAKGVGEVYYCVDFTLEMNPCFALWIKGSGHKHLGIANEVIGNIYSNPELLEEGV